MSEPALQKIDDGKQAVENSVEQYLTFLMDKDEYGVEILTVQEIHGWVEPRPIPNTPDFVVGVIDWRGTIVPVVDLRLRFGYDKVTYDNSTVVIVLKTEIKDINREVIVAVVVDAVSDVYDVTQENLRKAPSLGSRVDTEYIEGIAKVDEAMIVLLDLSKLINLERLGK